MAEQNAGNYLESYLDEKIFNQEGIHQSNFFNGRILTAQDLQDDQLANRNRLQQLGQAIGEGIVSGLEVELAAGADGSNGKPPVLHISPGLAFNRLGQAIALPVDISLTLARKPSPVPAEAGLFKTCPPGITSTDFHDRNVYILVASPASGYRGKAPQRGFNDGKVVGCGDRYAVEGVQFRTEELKVNNLSQLSQSTRDALAGLMSKDDDASLSKLRNWLAHVCFGTEELTGFLRDPLTLLNNRSPYLSYGAVDALRKLNTEDPAQGLTDCEVPLALLFWSRTGVRFADMWAVRRRLIPAVCSADWPLLEDGRGFAEADARFFQFQRQVGELVKQLTNPFIIKAYNYFRYLPPAGILGTALPKGISPTTFFQDLAVRYPRPPRFTTEDGPVFLEGARLKALLRHALDYPAIDIEKKEAVWLYRVRENHQATIAQTVIAFASGQLPYYGSPRFDAAYWGYSNYSSALLGPGGL